jgi:hypothetical protein
MTLLSFFFLAQRGKTKIGMSMVQINHERF